MNKKLTLKKAIIKNLGESDIAEVAGAGRFGRRLRRGFRNFSRRLQDRKDHVIKSTVAVSTGAVSGATGSPVGISVGAAASAVVSTVNETL